MQIKEKPFEDETFFFYLLNKYNYTGRKKLKRFDNFYNPPHKKIYYICYLFDEIIENKEKTQRGSIQKVTYHTQKALVFSSFYQFYDDLFFILKNIRKWPQKLINFDLEQMIYNFLFRIPAPCPGLKKVHVEYTNLFQLEFELKPINQIPNTGADIKSILKMKVNTIFDILKYVILEVPVIFFCKNKLILANTVKAFEEILFPFDYPFPVIEVLPKAYYKSLEKLSTFLVGINQNYKDNNNKNNFFEENDINLSDKDYVVVDLSEEEVNYICEKKKFEKYGILLKDFDKKIEKNQKIGKNSKKEVSFPKHYLNKLMKKLNTLLSGKNGLKKNINDIENEKVRYVFYYFYVSMFKNYKSFLKLDNIKLIDLYKAVENNTIEIEQLFNFKEFISKDMDNIDFYGCFMNTKIFKNFLIKNLYPSTIEEKMEILLFDDNIRIKKNKSMFNQLFQENTLFLNTDIFQIRRDKDEKILINSDKEIEMHFDVDINSQIENFPVLDDKKMENLFKNNFLEKEFEIKNLYIEFYNKCMQILKDKKYLEGYSSIGYNINLIDDLKSNNEPYVTKLWILIICYSFKYIDDEEKWVIFYEFLSEIQKNVFSRNSIIDPFLADLIFSTFVKYGDKQMCSLLYKELNECINVKEDYLIFMRLHKKFLSNRNEYEKIFPKNMFFKERNYNIFNLPNDKKMEIVLISPHPECRMVNLKPVLLNFSGQSEGELMYKCPLCQKIRKAEVTIILDKEKKEELIYQLYSAKYLFYFIKDLGDYNMQTFYKEYPEIFLNLFILFQLRGNFYEFIFPYKERKELNKFEENKLYEKNIKNIKYIKKEKNKDKPKWYEVIENDKVRQNRLTQIMPSKICSVENFNFSEKNNSEMFFKKYNKKIIGNTLRLKKKNNVENNI